MIGSWGWSTWKEPAFRNIAAFSVPINRVKVLVATYKPINVSLAIQTSFNLPRVSLQSYVFQIVACIGMTKAFAISCIVFPLPLSPTLSVYSSELPPPSVLYIATNDDSCIAVETFGSSSIIG